jgi:hypothetical protein
VEIEEEKFCYECKFFHECDCGIAAFPKGMCDIELCHVNCDNDACNKFELNTEI